MNAPINATAWERCAGVGVCDTGRHSDDLWRKKIFQKHLWLSQSMATEYLRINRAAGFAAANEFLRMLSDSLKIGGTGLLADMTDTHFCDYAEYKSKQAAIEILDFGRRFNKEQAIEHARAIVEAAGLEYPAEIKETDTKEQANKKHISALARVSCPKWWRRKIRGIAARKIEQACRVLGLVNRKKNVYVSDFTMERRKSQKRRNNQLLLNLVATNEDGFSLSLAEAAELGMSNPVNRRNELMVRIRGFEEIAKAMDCAGVFITLTAPSKYHAITENGHKNGKFNGSTPCQVQDYLNGVWAKVRASWARKGIKAFGFRVVEPHHDGTPHWHQILFIKKADIVQAMADFERYAIQEDREELKTDISPRFLAKSLEGISAAGYVAKYIAKNLDGYGVGEDYETGTAAADTAHRVEAWASTWGIRQFQQIGSVSVTVWREIRRARDVVANIDEATIWEISAACEAQDWARFVDLMGGAFVDRDKQTLRPLMVLADNENQYGETFEQVRGVIMRGVVKVISRWHTWTVKKKELVGGAFKYSDIEKAEFQRRARCGVGENRPPLDLCQ